MTKTLHYKFIVSEIVGLTGWDVEQQEAFPHLLGDENTSVWNYGAGKTGLDYCVKKDNRSLSRV